MVANTLSKKGNTVSSSCIWFGNFPKEITLGLHFDLYELKIVRKSTL